MRGVPRNVHDLKNDPWSHTRANCVVSEELIMEHSEHSEADEYIGKSNGKLKKIAGDLHKKLIAEGCSSYVKTIYIGYDFNGAMIAALYIRAEYVEVALALSESHESPILIDGSHLTWRTLPVAAIVRTKEDVRLFNSLVQSACEGVKKGEHTVDRDSEFFRKARRERNEKGVRPKRNS